MKLKVLLYDDSCGNGVVEKEIQPFLEQTQVVEGKSVPYIVIDEESGWWHYLPGSLCERSFKIGSWRDCDEQVGPFAIYDDDDPSQITYLRQVVEWEHLGEIRAA